MNFLAHAYLSFSHPEILAGNMISDFVKGKKKFSYPGMIQEGIRLHRAIDTYTDFHPVVAEAKKVFKPAVGLYAGAFTDVVFDHFLALDATELSDAEWKVFCEATYQSLEQFGKILPPAFLTLLPYMHKQNWLYNYRFMEGISNSFGGLTRRAKYLPAGHGAMDAFEQQYAVLQNCYAHFFPQLKAFAFNLFTTIIQVH